MLGFSDLNTLANYYDMGGFVMLPLVAVSVLLWYALAHRLMHVRGGRYGARELIEKARQGRIGETDHVTERAALLALQLENATRSKQELKSLLTEKFMLIRSEINQYRSLVRSLVAVAPLLGLLGTVDGMIETFNSLADMALFSSSGGIAGGISRALFTTQMGLAISIPGLLLGRMIENKQYRIYLELDQIKDLVCSTRDIEKQS